MISSGAYGTAMAKGVDDSCVERAPMGLGVFADAPPPASWRSEGGTVARASDGDLALRYRDFELVGRGAIEYPQDAVEPAITPDGRLSASAPALLVHLTEGTIVDQDGSRPVPAGVYLMTSRTLERVGSDTLAGVKLEPGADEISEAKPAQDDGPDPAPTLAQWQALSKSEQRTLTVCCHRTWSVGGDDASYADIADYVADRGFSKPHPYREWTMEQIDAQQAQVQRELDRLVDLGLVSTYDRHFYCVTQRGWDLLGLV